ncbi:MAG: metalloregulator ArsR/SmtB family transcription factor [Nitratireductor sp.]
MAATSRHRAVSSNRWPFGKNGSALENQISVCLSVGMNETEIFKALADPTRRAVFERLVEGEKNATQVREGLDVSQPAISQHLTVLRKAGLVRERRVGRHVNYVVDPNGLTPLLDWFDRYRVYWPARIERLKTLLKELDQ